VATDEDKKNEQAEEEAEGTLATAGEASAASESSEELGASGVQASEEGSTDVVPTQIGSRRYVHVAFLAAGLLLAFVLGKIFTAAWNRLAEWPTAVEALPQLQQLSEDERGSVGGAVGAVIGVAYVFNQYRKESVRGWADDVALELSKVSWPTRETVTNGTIVVLVASAVATVYVALLDRFWGFVTSLVYGA
jgi:preprotein translocase subunit SecE